METVWSGEKNSPVSMGRKFSQSFMFLFFRGAAAINGIALLVVIYFLVSRGWRAINWTFLTQSPMESMTKGGILPCIVGTLYLSLGAIGVALPIGVASAIYLHEYARPGRLLRIIRLGINNLAGVPSVVFGLFGLAFFVTWLKFGVSLLAGALTLVPSHCRWSSVPQRRPCAQYRRHTEKHRWALVPRSGKRSIE